MILWRNKYNELMNRERNTSELVMYEHYIVLDSATVITDLLKDCLNDSCKEVVSVGRFDCQEEKSGLNYGYVHIYLQNIMAFAG
jgi:hypothetical protein